MNHFKIFLTMLFIIFCITKLKAEIYYWTDENGVKRYSNSPPANVENVTILFKEYQFDKVADQKRRDADHKELKKLIEKIEKEDRRARMEEKSRLQEAKSNQLPSQEELIEAEKQRLQKKILELEARPFSYFGSEQKRRAHIDYYKKRLEVLRYYPDKYFSLPEK